MFGWSYPPGCNGPPEDNVMSPDAEKAWAILEKEGVEESIIEQICSIIDSLHIKAHADCPRCLSKFAEENDEEPMF
jgi:hypothetical protein